MLRSVCAKSQLVLKQTRTNVERGFDGFDNVSREYIELSLVLSSR